jgi:hypothetical protein
MNFAGRFTARFAHRLCVLAFSFHPSIEQISLEPPPIAKFEGWNALLAEIFVEGVWGDAQVMRRLAQRHYLLELFHVSSLNLPNNLG